MYGELEFNQMQVGEEIPPETVYEMLFWKRLNRKDCFMKEISKEDTEEAIIITIITIIATIDELRLITIVS
jgi:superfamily I DNA and/or RNA helicase